MDVTTEKKQDVLLTDEGDGKMKVVAGLDEQNRLKTVPPKQANEPDFMKIDKHGNALENFFTNYFKQASNPKHTGFYRVAMEKIEDVSNIISNLIKNGGDEGKEFLKDYKVDTSKYEKQDVDMSRGPQEDNSPKKEQEPQAKQSYQPLDKDKIDWEAFAKIGITRENLEKSGSLDAMLNYRRSPELHPVSMKVDNMALNTDARLSLRQVDDGRIIPVIHAVRKEPELDRPFYGNTFTKEDKEQLLKTGNLGRTIELNIKGLDKKIPSYVSIDQKTNELVAYSTKNVRIPNEIKGVTLDDRQKQELREGRAVYLEGMTAKSGKSFNANVQINAAERGITFRFDQQKQKQAQEQQQKQDGVRIPTKLGGVQLDDKQRGDLKKGEVVYVENMIDKKGERYNAYVKVNENMGKLDFYKWDPRQKNGVKADNASKTQVDVNTNGKTNEATKHNNDAMKKEQINPNSEQQQRQNQSRGRKM